MTGRITGQVTYTNTIRNKNKVYVWKETSKNSNAKLSIFVWNYKK